jgi:hypothetical protein
VAILKGVKLLCVMIESKVYLVLKKPVFIVLEQKSKRVIEKNASYVEDEKLPAYTECQQFLFFYKLSEATP